MGCHVPEIFLYRFAIHCQAIPIFMSLLEERSLSINSKGKQWQYLSSNFMFTDSGSRICQTGRQSQRWDANLFLAIFFPETWVKLEKNWPERGWAFLAPPWICQCFKFFNIAMPLPLLIYVGLRWTNSGNYFCYNEVKAIAIHKYLSQTRSGKIRWYGELWTLPTCILRVNSVFTTQTSGGSRIFQMGGALFCRKWGGAHPVFR